MTRSMIVLLNDMLYLSSFLDYFLITGPLLIPQIDGLLLIEVFLVLLLGVLPGFIHLNQLAVEGASI